MRTLLIYPKFLSQKPGLAKLREHRQLTALYNATLSQIADDSVPSTFEYDASGADDSLEAITRQISGYDKLIEVCANRDRSIIEKAGVKGCTISPAYCGSISCQAITLHKTGIECTDIPPAPVPTVISSDSHYGMFTHSTFVANLGRFIKQRSAVFLVVGSYNHGRTYKSLLDIISKLTTDLTADGVLLIMLPDKVSASAISTIPQLTELHNRIKVFSWLDDHEILATMKLSEKAVFFVQQPVHRCKNGRTDGDCSGATPNGNSDRLSSKQCNSPLQ